MPGLIWIKWPSGVRQSDYCWNERPIVKCLARKAATARGVASRELRTTGRHSREQKMLRRFLWILAAASLLHVAGLMTPALADDQPAPLRIQEEVWALPFPIPMFGYVVRPVGDGPFPLVIMNHGVSLHVTERRFYHVVSFSD